MSSTDIHLSDKATTDPSSQTEAVVGTTSSENLEENITPAKGNSAQHFSSVDIDTHHRKTTPTGEELSSNAGLDPDPEPVAEMKVNHKLKYISLLVLVVQNTALVLTMRYSRTVTSGPLYLASTAVVLTELLKFIICMGMIFRSNEFDPARTITVMKTEIIDKKGETLRLSVPSVLYTIQNNLLYIALTHLDAATFQVRYVGLSL